MIHKGQLPAMLAALALFSPEGRAERRSVSVMETSTSGKLARISLGARQGVAVGQPVLFSAGSKKIAAGRVLRVRNSTAIVVVLESYGEETPMPDADYELVYGEPFGEAPNLPDYVADRDSELDNPGNEKFWRKDEEDSPELDDETYMPEISLRPKFPLPRTYSPHNVTVGLSIFRNAALADSVDENGSATTSARHTTYQGYSVRYAYTFRTHYWLKSETPALISAEFGVGMYNFLHTFPTGLRPSPELDTAEIRVVPIHVGLRYLLELSRLFRLYPYVGYQYNIVGAVDGSIDGISPLMGGRLLGGAGAVLVMSDTIDARVEAGTDGVLGGLVVKF